MDRGGFGISRSGLQPHHTIPSTQTNVTNRYAFKQCRLCSGTVNAIKIKVLHEATHVAWPLPAVILRAPTDRTVRCRSPEDTDDPSPGCSVPKSASQRTGHRTLDVCGLLRRRARPDPRDHAGRAMMAALPPMRRSARGRCGTDAGGVTASACGPVRSLSPHRLDPGFASAMPLRMRPPVCRAVARQLPRRQTDTWWPTSGGGAILE